MIDKTFFKPVEFVFLFVVIVSFAPYKLISETKNQSNMNERKIAKKHIVFLVTEDSLNYQAHKTIPVFAQLLEKQMGYKTTILLGTGTHGAYSYPDFEIVDQADLLVVFARRIALPHQQMNLLKKYLSSGRPLVGIRTANHAFTATEKISEGFEDWPEFVSTILGCQNRGYGPVDPGTDVSVEIQAINHPIVKGLTAQWHSKGNVYKVTPLLDSNITVLLKGKANNLEEPIAWIRRAGKSKIFYTSLGYSTDFEAEPFINLIEHAIKWTLTDQEKQ